MTQMTEPTGGPIAGTATSGSGTTTETAKQAATEAKEGAKHVAGEAKEHAAELAGDAWGQARTVLDQAMGSVREQGDQQAQRAATNLRSLSDQFRALSEGRSQDAGRLGELATQASDRVQSFASRLETGGWQSVAGDVSSFARRRPGLFLAAAAGLGFVAGRALRAGQAARQSDGQESYGAYGTTSYGAVGYPTPMAEPVAYGTTGYDAAGYATTGYATGPVEEYPRATGTPSEFASPDVPVAPDLTAAPAFDPLLDDPAYGPGER